MKTNNAQAQEIPKKTIEDYWHMVNSCSNLDEMKTAEMTLSKAEGLDNDEYNELMMALSYLTMEAYRQD